MTPSALLQNTKLLGPFPLWVCWPPFAFPYVVTVSRCWRRGESKYSIFNFQIQCSSMPFNWKLNIPCWTLNIQITVTVHTSSPSFGTSTCWITYGKCWNQDWWWDLSFCGALACEARSVCLTEIWQHKNCHVLMRKCFYSCDLTLVFFCQLINSLGQLFVYWPRVMPRRSARTWGSVDNGKRIRPPATLLLIAQG